MILEARNNLYSWTAVNYFKLLTSFFHLFRFYFATQHKCFWVYFKLHIPFLRHHLQWKVMARYHKYTSLRELRFIDRPIESWNRVTFAESVWPEYRWPVPNHDLNDPVTHLSSGPIFIWGTNCHNGQLNCLFLVSTWRLFAFCLKFKLLIDCSVVGTQQKFSTHGQRRGLIVWPVRLLRGAVSQKLQNNDFFFLKKNKRKKKLNVNRI